MVVVEQIDSQYVAGNLMGDPSRRDLLVYIPPSYDMTDGGYPVAYLLHGFGAQAMDWLVPDVEATRVRQPIDEILDPVFTKYGADDLIVVMPDGWSKYGCSQWVDSPVNGNFEQYVVHEIVSYVDDHFRTIPRAASRGIFGISSGGFGAWHLASRHPDVFSAMALLSADSFFERTLLASFYDYYNRIYPTPPDGPTSDPFSELCYGLATCYSPNPDKPPHYVDLPVEFPSGAVVPDIWAKWVAYDPIVNWRERADNLRRLRGIFLDVGSHDEYNLHYGHRLLSRALTGAGIPHIAEEHSGSHTGRLSERIQRIVVWLSQVLERA